MKNETIWTAQSPVVKGMGVFASRDIKAGKIVEVCPLLLMPMKDFKHIQKTKLHYYFFEYTNQQFAIALGYGSLYNHSYDPNARYLYNFLKKTMTIKAIKDIKKDEEIFINYNYYPEDKTPLESWFLPMPRK